MLIFIWNILEISVKMLKFIFKGSKLHLKSSTLFFFLLFQGDSFSLSCLKIFHSFISNSFKVFLILIHFLLRSLNFRKSFLILNLLFLDLFFLPVNFIDKSFSFILHLFLDILLNWSFQLLSHVCLWRSFINFLNLTLFLWKLHWTSSSWFILHLIKLIDCSWWIFQNFDSAFCFCDLRLISQNLLVWRIIKSIFALWSFFSFLLLFLLFLWFQANFIRNLDSWLASCISPKFAIEVIIDWWIVQLNPMSKVLSKLVSKVFNLEVHWPELQVSLLVLKS